MKQLPVIIISTSSDTQIIERMFALGANLYLSKPTSYRDFKSLVRQTLEWGEGIFSISKEQFLLKP